MTEFHITSNDEILRIARVLSRIAWPMPVRSMGQLATELGWQSGETDTSVRITTNLPVNARMTKLIRHGDELGEFSVYISDHAMANASSSELDTCRDCIAESFKSVRSSLSCEYGAWSSHRPGDAWWDLPTGGRLKLSGDGSVLALRILSQHYADVERSEERLGIRQDRVLGEDE